jgi:hypothetical protein
MSLLREVLEKRMPELLMSILPKAEVNRLDREERTRVCTILGAEIWKTGCDSDYELLPRGIQLERLIDVLNRPNLSTDSG